MASQIQSGLAVSEVVEHQLRFLKMFTSCLLDSEEAGRDRNLLCSVNSLYEILMEDRSYVSLSLVEKFEQFESKIREDCDVMLDSLKSRSWSMKEILRFIICLVWNLKGLANLKVEIFVCMKNQIRLLTEKLSFLEMLLHFMVKNCSKSEKKVKDLLDNFVRNWVHDAAILSLLCLLKGKDENVAQILETMLSDLLHKIKHCISSPEFMRICIEHLKASKPSRSDKLQVGQIVTALVDFLLENLLAPLKEYGEILRDGLIFIITLSVDPVQEAVKLDGRIPLRRIKVVVNEVLSLTSLLNIDSLGGEVSLASLQYKIEEVKMEIRKLINVQVTHQSDSNFPAINFEGFVDSFLENMKEMVKPNSIIAFARHQIVIVQEELLFLKPFLHDIMELQKERRDLKDLWNRIINTVFLAENAIASCSSVDHPIWYDMLWLSDVIQGIKLMKSEVKKHNDEIHNAKMTSTNTNSSDVLKTQANPSSSLVQDDVVGMEDESEKIIGKLIRGTTQLDIVSIVGMPGLGKTTLAKKVYNDPSVKYFFHRRAWCCVTQMYNSRELYFDILSDVNCVDARKNYSNYSDYDLADRLRRDLKGQKYLIVLDDIWSIEAWDSMKRSFPEDRNGSRIMFTSRIHDLVSQPTFNCSPYFLGPLSDEESWELFRKRLSHCDSSPLDDKGEIAKCIVKNCGGLPLAVVLVAGILAGRNLEFYKLIAKTTVSKVVSEGCMAVLEQSYKHLPNHLKPCFLYFGAFPEARDVRSRKLINLWIAEGFIPRSDKESIHKVAEAYLSELIRRSLVILTERSSSGSIKACRVHDLLRDLCLVKIQEENFLTWVQKNDVSQAFLHPRGYDSYRLCIDNPFLKSPFTKFGGPFVRSIISCSNYISWNRRSDKPMDLSLFDYFKLINVFHLERVPVKIGFLRAGISSMIHLRHLSIDVLLDPIIPESITSLWTLETLILMNGMFHLPNTFWKMKRLRYVYVTSIALLDIEFHQYSELEHMDTFTCPYFCSRDQMKELARRLPGLRKLKCGLRPFEHDSLKFPELSCFSGLEALEVWYEHESSRVEVLPFPTVDFPTSLKRLTLSEFRLSWKAISIIGELPNLEVLKLRERAISGTEWEVKDGEFSKLEFLELSSLNFKQWSIPDDEPFPSLKRLILEDCVFLERIPPSLGYIPSLNKIEMKWCSETAATSARDILQEQQDMGNDDLELFCVDLPVSLLTRRTRMKGMHEFSGLSEGRLRF